MKRLVFIVLATLFTSFSFSQNTPENVSPDSESDSDNVKLSYRHGTVTLKGNIAKITLPENYKYLDAEQAEMILTEFWGNQHYNDMTLGFILPENMNPLAYTSYVFNIEYENIGYVKDTDAGKIDFDDILKILQEETEENNADRIAGGYDKVSLVGWASKPYYDEKRKILHWAKEFRFGDSEDENILNYNIRILGRKGMLTLNAIAGMSALTDVKNDIQSVLAMVEFTDGNRYSDFTPGTDKVAQWSIGGLIAGKANANTSIAAFLHKYWILIAIAAVAILFFLFKWTRTKKESNMEEPHLSPEEISATAYDPEDIRADQWEAAREASATLVDDDIPVSDDEEDTDENEKSRRE